LPVTLEAVALEDLTDTRRLLLGFLPDARFLLRLVVARIAIEPDEIDDQHRDHGQCACEGHSLRMAAEQAPRSLDLADAPRLHRLSVQEALQVVGQLVGARVARGRVLLEAL